MAAQVALRSRAHEVDETETRARRGLPHKVFTYKIVIIGLLLILVGLILLMIAAHGAAGEAGHAGISIEAHLTRDIGLALLTTGIILLPFDYFVRKEFLTLVRDTVTEAFATDLEPRFIEVRECIALSDGLRALGVEEIFEQRTQVKLADLLAEAKPESEIRLLGIVITDLTSPAIQKIVTHKLEEGCRIKILCLSPESRCVEERAVEEGRAVEEMRKELVGMRAIRDTFVNDRLGGSQGRIELRYYDASPRYFIFSTGRAMVFSLYTGKTRGASATHFRLRVKDNGFSQQLLQHFDWLWAHAPPPPAASAVGAPA